MSIRTNEVVSLEGYKEEYQKSKEKYTNMSLNEHRLIKDTSPMAKWWWLELKREEELNTYLKGE